VKNLGHRAGAFQAMHHDGTVIRPPSEADSIILQATVGCPHNRCTFCGAYKGARFRITAPERIEEDLKFAAEHCRRLTRVFLADGDTLMLRQERLKPLLKRIRQRLPWVSRLGTYCSARSLARKTLQELEELRGLGLDRLYMGLESGDDQTLHDVKKGVDAAIMVAMGRKARQAGFFLSVTVLLGIAGRERSRIHARETGRVLTAMGPNQIAALTLIVIPGTPLHTQVQSGAFRLPDREGLLMELRVLLEHIGLERAQFHSNHASNYLPLSGRLARDRGRLLADIDRAVRGESALVPEYMRRL